MPYGLSMVALYPLDIVGVEEAHGARNFKELLCTLCLPAKTLKQVEVLVALFRMVVADWPVDRLCSAQSYTFTCFLIAVLCPNLFSPFPTMLRVANDIATAFSPLFVFACFAQSGV